MNSKNNSGGIKRQTTNINNISHGTVTIAKQNPDNSNLDFNVVRDSAPSVPTILATPQTGGEKSIKTFIAIESKHLCNQIILAQLVVMLLTYYNLPLNVKPNPWVSVNCLLLVTVA